MTILKAALFTTALCCAEPALSNRASSHLETYSPGRHLVQTDSNAFKDIDVSVELFGEQEAQFPAIYIALSNPAADYCVETGGTYETRSGADGEYGVCVLADGNEIDAWEYFRQQQMANPAAVFCIETGGTYVMRKSESGTVGTCTLADGTETDAWEYFRANAN